MKERIRSTLKSKTDRKHAKEGERERDGKKENVFVSPIRITQHACLSLQDGAMTSHSAG